MRTRGSAALWIVAVALGASPAWAAPSTPPAGAAPAEKPSGGADSFLGELSLTSRDEPIVVHADQLEFDYQKNSVVYRGTVHVTQGDLAIDCKELTVTYDPADDAKRAELREVVATGDVVISQGTRRATGGKAVFSQPQRTIVLMQNPVLHDGPNEVSGERLIVYLDEGRSVVESSKQKRVSATLYPGKSDSKLEALGTAGGVAAGEQKQ
jgi:lipopolysaccharide export system protein LptA